jgi:hypothetical protein
MFVGEVEMNLVQTQGGGSSAEGGNVQITLFPTVQRHGNPLVVLDGWIRPSRSGENFLVYPHSSSIVASKFFFFWDLGHAKHALDPLPGLLLFQSTLS